jgi:hypothetical protein
VVLAVLVAAGVYVPRWEKARAGGKASQSTQQPANPAPNTPADSGENANQSQPANATATPSGSQQPATNASEGQSTSPPSNSASNPAPAGTAGTANPPAGDSGHTKATEANNGSGQHPSNPPSQGRSSGNQVQSSEQSSAQSSGSSTPSGQSQGGAQQAGSTASQAPAADSAELDELEHQMDQLSSRATAAHDGVENLRRQQSQQGLNLRGDISAAEDRMGTYMGKAQAAFQNQDAKGTKKFMELAETEVETLEKFLGRR